MTNTEREQIIKNALRDYNAAKQTGDNEKIARAVNDMENVFYCVSRFAVNGTEKLRETIIKANYNA